MLADAAIEVAGGRVLRVHARAPRGRREVVDHGEVALVPGLVDAHAHLELSAARGLLPRTSDLAAWIEALLAWRRSSGARDLVPGAREGARRLLATGTTAVGDIDSSGAVLRALAELPLRCRVYREVLDAGDRSRTAASLAAWDAALAARPGQRRVRPGLSPHAPYTVSAELWSELGRRARRRRLAVGIHWAESEAEEPWLLRGEGPLARLLARSPRRTGLDAIESAGLLGPRTALYHGNHPAAGDRERVAASGATLVHCPGAHAWFGRERFPIERWLAAGVPLALGTDSLASNEDLDMRREMALLRAAAPALAPATVLALATTGAARALGWGSGTGTLAQGAPADFAAHRLLATSAAEVLEALTSGAGEVVRVSIGGRALPRERLTPP